MKPDFWLDRHGDDRYVLTPCSALGKMAFPGLDLGLDLTNYRVLNHEQSQFMSVVLTDAHYRVRQVDRRQTTKCHAPAKPTQVNDTRPKPRPGPVNSRPSRVFPHSQGLDQHMTERQELIAKSFTTRRIKGKTVKVHGPKRKLSLHKFLHKLTPFDQ